MAGQFLKSFGEEGVGRLSSSIAKAVKQGVEAGNPGGEGTTVEVTVASGTGTEEIGGDYKYGHPVLFSALPSDPGVAWTIADNALTVKADSGFSGTITFWIHS